MKLSKKEKKEIEKEYYGELIWDLFEDFMELSEETKKDIEEGLRDFKKGKFYALEEVEKEAGID